MEWRVFFAIGLFPNVTNLNLKRIKINKIDFNKVMLKCDHQIIFILPTERVESWEWTMWPFTTITWCNLPNNLRCYRHSKFATQILKAQVWNGSKSFKVTIWLCYVATSNSFSVLTKLCFNVTDLNLVSMSSLLTHLGLLEHLEFARGDVTQGSIAFLAKLSHLRILNLEGSICPEQVDDIATCTKLENLNLAYNLLTNKQVEKLTSLQNLRYLNLSLNYGVSNLVRSETYFFINRLKLTCL